MEPRIEALSEKLFVGKNATISLSNNTTRALWQGFMPDRAEIKNHIGHELYSIDIYDPGYFDNFDVHTVFEKWAAVEVPDFNSVPEAMSTLCVPTGLYAVFIHKGPPSLGPKTYEYILTTWLPHSDYVLDTRPHFAVMSEKYNPTDPNSEEELWIPIKPKIER